jgi:predicted DNA-binding transcriptional regulator YafY
MSKIKRLEKLLLSINSKKQFTLKELAIEFQVSTRTIQRDLLKLMEMGLPIISEFGPHGGYRIENDRILPPIGFTEMEASAILFGLQTFEEESFPFQIQSRSVSKKLLHYLPEDAKENWEHIQKRLFVQSPLPSKNIVAPVILEAAIKQKIVTILFKIKEERTYCNIQPIGLYSEKGEWYCPAFCYTLMDFHIFKITDIVTAVINYEPMDVKDFSNITIHNWAGKVALRSFLELHADLTEEGEHYCSSHFFLKQFLQKADDGSGYLKGRILTETAEKIAEYLWPLKGNQLISSPPEILDLHRKWADEVLLKKEPILNM